MKPTEIKDVIATMIKMRRPLYVTGAPGGGKTQIIQQVAERMGLQCALVHMPTMLVEDFGIPMPKDGRIEYMMPHWWPADPDSRGVLLFDDRGQCGADLQKVLANIIQERELHGRRLPAGWSVISTGNRASDQSGAVRTLRHLANRETRLAFETCIDDWSAYAASKGVDSRLVAFLNFRSELLSAFDPNKDVNATPRSWMEGVNPLLAVYAERDPVLLELAAGAVGDGPAAEFIGFLRVYETLPSIKDVLDGKVAWSERYSDPATLYAITGSLADQMQTGEHFANAAAFLQGSNRGEFVVLLCSLVKGVKPDIMDTSAFSLFALANQDLFFG